MRRTLSFPCEGASLAATLDEAAGSAGLLVVSGGNEIRIGAHRGMAKLAADVAAAGHPVFRFDRRGIGDSEGENSGFTASAPDLAAAITAFRAACPALTRIVAFGNCDAASALALHMVAGIDALVIANPWVIEATADAPPPAAIKAHYAQRLRDPKAWMGLFTGAIDLRKLAGGLLRVASPQPPSTLAAQIACGMTSFPGPISILLATRDGTAIAFAAEWKKSAFSAVKARTDVAVTEVDSGSHSFASAADYDVLNDHVLTALRG
jgi:exosortase A-associated hydrolase 1